MRVGLVIFVVALFGQWSLAAEPVRQTSIISEGDSFGTTISIDTPSSFLIDNGLGATRVYATDESEVIRVGVTEIKYASEIKLGVVGLVNGKIKIEIVYPFKTLPSKVGGGGLLAHDPANGIRVREGFVNLGGNYSTTMQDALATVRKPGFDMGGIYGEARLEVGIPRKMLNHLAVYSSVGDIEIENFDSPDAIADFRILSVLSDPPFGKVTIRNTRAERIVREQPVPLTLDRCSARILNEADLTTEMIFTELEEASVF